MEVSFLPAFETTALRRAHCRRIQPVSERIRLSELSSTLAILPVQLQFCLRDVSPDVSINFPVTCETAIVVALAKIQFDCVERHGTGKIGPSPDVTACISSLTGPPLSGVISRSRSEVLHQKTGVNSNQDTRAEVAEEAEDLTDAIAVFERGFLRKRASS
jgi:hypothetical protein